jgi:CheY-like chemotaxis protein
MTMKVLVGRRYQLNEKKDNPSQLMTSATHDMRAPLSSVYSSLSILNNDASVKTSLGEQRVELLHRAASCTELLTRMYGNTLEALGLTENLSTVMMPTKILTEASGSTGIDNDVAVTNMIDLVKRLHMIVDPIPKKIPCIVTLDKSVPNEIVADDVKLFRCALNLLMNAIDRTNVGKVHLTIRWDGDMLLLFECEDCGPDIPVEQYQNLFQRGHDDSTLPVGLLSIALLIDSLDGEYGVRPKNIDNDGNIFSDSNGRRRSGSIFWFSIPLVPVLPKMFDVPTAVLPPKWSTNVKKVYPPSVALSSDKNVALPDLMIQCRNSMSAVKIAPYTNIDVDKITEIKNPTNMHTGMGLNSENAISHFLSPPGTDPDTLDILDKLAMDLNVSVTAFEPNPVEIGTDNINITKDMMRKRRALVIDDSLVVRRCLSQSLNHLGFDVVEACDGMEGLKELQQVLYDIVFCDFMMPIMDGVT